MTKCLPVDVLMVFADSVVVVIVPIRCCVLVAVVHLEQKVVLFSHIMHVITCMTAEPYVANG